MGKLVIYECGGIVIEIGDHRLLFDPWGKCDGRFDAIFVSHAHMDHVAGLPSYMNGKTPIYMSRETYEILKIQGIANGPNPVIFISPKDNVEVSSKLNVSIYNAGHVVGSLMFKVENRKISIGYTGDFNFEENAVLPQADLMHPDILLIDTTYGSPRYSFPPRSVLYEKIRVLINDILDSGKKPILHGYALGKGQELTKVSSLFFSGKVSVDARVGQINRVYERITGNKLGEYSIGDGGPILIRGINKRKHRIGNHVHVFFTGWAMSRRFESAISIPLSSHTGFVKLLDYIVKNDPYMVYPLFGFEKSFSRFIRKDLGVKAEPIPKKPYEITYGSILRAGKRKYLSLDGLL